MTGRVKTIFSILSPGEKPYNLTSHGVQKGFTFLFLSPKISIADDR